MSDDFAPFPLAVALQDDNKLVIEIKNPDLKKIIPHWGNHCLWTDPPPEDCFPDRVPDTIFKLSSNDFSNNDINNLRHGLGVTGKVSPDIDINTIPPHLRPLIKTISDLINKSETDIKNMDISGMSLILHKNI